MPSGINSRAKGASGEREAAMVLNKVFGTLARRGCQYSGGPDSPDVSGFIDGIHIEVKRTERLQLYKALDQATTDCGESVPVVMHRKNRSPWVLVIKVEDMPRVIELLEENKRQCKNIDNDC